MLAKEGARLRRLRLRLVDVGEDWQFVTLAPSSRARVERCVPDGFKPQVNRDGRGANLLIWRSTKATSSRPSFDAPRTIAIAASGTFGGGNGAMSSVATSRIAIEKTTRIPISA